MNFSNGSKVMVIGSINYDIILHVDCIPKIGQTVESLFYNQFIGGKGANQAIAASKLGSLVKFVGTIANDNHGKFLLDGLKKTNIDISLLEVISNNHDIKSGMAAIITNGNNNQIVVYPGANHFITKDRIINYRSDIKLVDIIICQLEIPFDVVVKAMELANFYNKIFILNPSPVSKELLKNIDFIMDKVSYLILNETEMEEIFGVSSSLDENKILKKYQNKIILTKGDKGVLFYSNNKIYHIDALKVNVIDTTGAGDAFLGAFANYLNMGIDKAIRLANAYSALTVMKSGAFHAMASKDIFDNFIDKMNILS